MKKRKKKSMKRMKYFRIMFNCRTNIAFVIFVERNLIWFEAKREKSGFWTLL